MAKYEISKTIKAYKPRIEAAKSLQEEGRKKALVLLFNEATDERRKAIQNGANSYGIQGTEFRGQYTYFPVFIRNRLWVI